MANGYFYLTKDKGLSYIHRSGSTNKLFQLLYDNNDNIIGIKAIR